MYIDLAWKCLHVQRAPCYSCASGVFIKARSQWKWTERAKPPHVKHAQHKGRTIAQSGGNKRQREHTTISEDAEGT